jgi:hypothetical protein
MKYEIQKISRIVDVVIDFFMTHSSSKINISIEDAPDRYIIVIQSENINCNPEMANKLNRLLNVQRQREIEEYYWQLGGNDVEGDEINLIGMMVDEAIIENNCPSIKITLIRKKK